MKDCRVYKITATVTVTKSDVENYYECNDMEYDDGTEFTDADYRTVAESLINDGDINILEIEE